MAVRRKNVAVDLFRGLLIAILLTLVAMLAAAALAIFARISDSAIRALNQAIKLGAILFGVRAAVPRGGVHGFATGAVIAMAYMILGYGLYVLLGGGAFSIVAMLGEILIGAAVGGVIGAIRANQSAQKRRGKAA